MKILVIGGGGREHALVWKLAASPRVSAVYCAPGNAGTAAEANNVDISPTDFPRLVKFAKEEQIDLTVVGPEGPLVLGIVDTFMAEGLRIFGPTKAAAELEGSKVFSKELMRGAGVPTADFHVFRDADSARIFVTDREDARDRTLKRGVDLDEAAFVAGDAELIEPESLAEGPSPDAHEDDLGFDFILFAAVGGLGPQRDPARLGLRGADLRAECELETLFTQAALRCLGDLAIHARQNVVEDLYHCDVRAEARPDRAQFESDRTRADHDQAPGNAFEGERSGRRDDLLLVDREAGHAGRFGAGRDQDVR